MASTILRRSMAISCQLVKNGVSKTVTTQQIKPHAFTKAVARSMSHISKRKHTLSTMSSSLFQKKSEHCRLCKCGAHTDIEKGNVEFSEFLSKEIELEKERMFPAKGIDGWKVETKSAEVTLSRSLGNEQLTVTFNVNNAIDGGADLVEGEEANLPLTSKPPFTVEIKKPSGKILSMQCSYPEYEEQGEEADLYNILEVAMYEGEWTDNTFSVATDTMDEHMYEMLMDMLHDRGIDDKFIQDLIDFSTGYEQATYVNLLKDLKSFVDEK